MTYICTGRAHGLIFHTVLPGQSRGPIQSTPYTAMVRGSINSNLLTRELSAVNFSAALLGHILVWKRTTRKQYRVKRSVLIAVN